MFDRLNCGKCITRDNGFDYGIWGEIEAKVGLVKRDRAVRFSNKNHFNNIYKFFVFFFLILLFLNTKFNPNICGL